MAITVVRTESARDDYSQTIQSLYKRVSVGTDGLDASTTPDSARVGVLPANAMKLQTIVTIVTSFDGTMTVGTTADTDAYGQSDDITAGAIDTYAGDRGMGVSTSDQVVYARLTSGTTQGVADIWVTYLKAR